MSRTPDLLPVRRPSIPRWKSDIELRTYITPAPATSPSLGVSAPSRPPNTREGSSRSQSATRTPIPTGRDVPGSSITELRVGVTAKAFFIHSDLLATRSSYFRKVFDGQDAGTELTPMFFPDLDEFAFVLFVRWLYGAQLNGPSDYHSMQHYLGLYVLAFRFRVERLGNEIVDLVRLYYREANMTAPAYRLDYIYHNTSEPNMMRKFLVYTAAFRAMCEGVVSNGINDCMARGGEMAADLATALVDCHKNGMVDVRRGADCVWHEHTESKRCKRFFPEPWENL